MSVLLSSPKCPNVFPCKYNVMIPSKPASGNLTKSHIRIVPTPLLQRLEHNRMCRRQAYIAKVKRNGDDRKWEHRCDQILRDEFVSHRKRWEEENELSAPSVPDFEDFHPEGMHMDHLEAGTELEDTVGRSTAERVVPADDDLEDFLRREREEIEALVDLASEHSDYPDENEIIDLLSAVADKEYNTPISHPTSTAVLPQAKNLQAPAEYEEDVDIGWS